MQEWVRQTSHHHHYQEEATNDFDDLELERFAYDIAESLVSSMEKNAGIQTKVCHLFLFLLDILKCCFFLIALDKSMSNSFCFLAMHVWLFSKAAYFLLDMLSMLFAHILVFDH